MLVAHLFRRRNFVWCFRQCEPDSDACANWKPSLQLTETQTNPRCWHRFAACVVETSRVCSFWCVNVNLERVLSFCLHVLYDRGGVAVTILESPFCKAKKSKATKNVQRFQRVEKGFMDFDATLNSKLHSTQQAVLFSVIVPTFKQLGCMFGHKNHVGNHFWLSMTWCWWLGRFKKQFAFCVHITVKCFKLSLMTSVEVWDYGFQIGVPRF